MKDPSPSRRKIKSTVFKMGRTVEEKARVRQLVFVPGFCPLLGFEDRVTSTKTDAQKVANYSAKGID